MFPSLPQEKASKILQELILSLKKGETNLVQVARPSEERKNQGVMLGALVCKDKNNNEVNLVTNSGIAKIMRNSEFGIINYENVTKDAKRPLSNNNSELIYVEAIVSPKEIEEALAENDKKIHELTEKIKTYKLQNDKNTSTESKQPATEGNSEFRILNSELKHLCSTSLSKVHALYKFHCIDGNVRTLKEICDTYNPGKLPPTGTGDCCAPKLLDYAFSHDLMPVSLAETAYTETSGNDCSTAEGVPLAVWSDSGSAESVTAKPDRPTPNSSLLTPPCDERCGILLPAMLGLRILYRDEAICVVNKQSGLLSVPGRGEDNQDCIESRFRRLFGDRVEIVQSAVHRLDMETSGVMILAFTKDSHRKMMRQFEEKEVHKEYVALLDGVLPKKGIAKHGQMELFFRLDVDNRPHQIWDAENGKSAVTEWEILGVERYHAPDGTTRNATRVRFLPHTGRTHQLRLASADSHGFCTPIIGDTLYGKCEPGERLMLHAQKVTFTHPTTGERMTIDCAPEF